MFKNNQGFTDVIVMTIIGGIIGSLFIVGVFVWKEIELNNTLVQIKQVVDKQVVDQVDNSMPVDNNDDKKIDYVDNSSKVIYGSNGSKEEEYRVDCEARGGRFNLCDSACPPGGGVCIEVCVYSCDVVKEVLGVPELYPEYDWSLVNNGEIVSREALYRQNEIISVEGKEWVAKYGTEEMPEFGFYHYDNNFFAYYQKELADNQGWVYSIDNGSISAMSADGPTGSVQGLIGRSGNDIRVIMLQSILNEYRVFVSDVIPIDNLGQ